MAVRCNMYETGIGATSPVGIFAKDQSPYGAFDLPGNILEWTNSLYKEYPYSEKDGREETKAESERMLRGDSFAYTRGNGRCAVRNWDPSTERSYNVGFRVVSPAFETLASEIAQG